MNRSKSSHPARDSALAYLREQIEKCAPDPLPKFEWHLAARGSGYSVRQLKRLVVDNPPPALRFEVTDQVSDAVFLSAGNLRAAYERLHRLDVKLPSESTFRRVVIEEMGTATIEFARKGEPGFRNATLYLPGPDGEDGPTYLMDHTELPIWVVPAGHRRPIRPWMTCVMDHTHRYLLSWVITFGRPSEAEVRAALVSAIEPRLAPDGQTLVGGRPARVRWDRGLEFLANSITESCLRLNIQPSPLPAYCPHQKGRLERFWDYLKDNALPAFPGYADPAGPVDLAGKTLQASHALSEEGFLLELEVWMDRYITEHVVSTIDMTPLVSWQEEQRVLDIVPHEQLWHDFLKAKRSVKVSKKGVRFEGLDYLPVDDPSGALFKLVGRSVEVRYLPGRKEFIEVFHDGKHVGPAVPARSFAQEDTEMFLATRRKARIESRARHNRADRIRDAHPQAQKLTKVRVGSREFLEVEAEPFEEDPKDLAQTFQDLLGPTDEQPRLL